ncbi:NAD-dependent epimerase/dehydratase family protein [Vibrio plantisponsor]|uniref:NAD-dependent epimerase/dehydratase family protein n=1 Tax=Vibrio plantisponsor TaxID=664643 RepID=A0ABU4III2_9VIBR|nr:NAD-dependent epimerase/dehydratase family protein [Vibrio plantisponsor]MDW6018306.1 NAD-dependent epimerase/dehydratase family protein [Vibrio plantisponsor]NNM41889.1 NAD-dependent epimerase/dehydratase family protein [Vibrio plantisponsor]
MKKILITGGAGFVGSHLCERLAQDNECEVYSLDNYFTGNESNHVSNVKYIKGSTKDISSLVDFSPDIVFHLGEYSRVEQSFDDIEKVLEFNKIGTYAVLEFVRKHKCKLLYAGSSTKFGDSGENANASPYAWSKSTNTTLVKNYAEWFGIDYAITYFYNVYGPREIQSGKYATLIALFKEKMRNNEELTVVSPGTQVRNFTHVDDTIDALLLIGKYGHGDEYGIGSPECYTILEVAKMFGGKIKMLSERKGNRMLAEVIDDKTRGLGWKPKRRLEDFINECKIDNWEI